MKFSELLKETRKRFKFSQKSLADMLGLKAPTISKYENGIAFPSVGVLRVLCQLFQWDVANIYQMVYSEKAPETARPFLRGYESKEEGKEKLPMNSNGYPALTEFLQDPKMPRPTEAELEILISIKVPSREPTKWFYKSLLDDLRNEGLFQVKSSAREGLKFQENE